MPLLPRAQRGAVALAASAWGFTGEPEALVRGDASVEPPALDRTAAPSIDAPAAMPGDAPGGKKAPRSRRSKRPKD